MLSFIPQTRLSGLRHTSRFSFVLKYQKAGFLERCGRIPKRYISDDVALPGSADTTSLTRSTPEPPAPARPNDTAFVPRTTFPSLPSLPRSYFLGHHKAGLEKMKGLLNTIDLVLECRDYRVPVTSRNPLFEKALEGKERVVVFTKRDLGGGTGKGRGRDEVEETLSKWCEAKRGVVGTLFTRSMDTSSSASTDDKWAAASGRKSLDKVIQFLKQHAQGRWKLVGHRVLVVGMPNVGKSTLLNGLRGVGMKRGKKVAKTGAQPGVTRKVGTGVKVVPGEDDVEELDGEEGEGQNRRNKKNEGVGGGVYVLDTPGVFIPYVPSSTAMMKLALVGSVKDTIIPPVLLADYLLFHLNRVDPSLYRDFARPTNDVVQFLENVARKLGRIGKGGKVDLEASAIWVVQRWRRGELGRFVLDEVDGESLREEGEDAVLGLGDGVVSLNQARRAERERRRERGRERARGKGILV